MSVLNQMLRDLESRGVGAETTAQEAEPYAAPAAPVVRPLAQLKDAPRGSPLVRIAVWTGVAVVVVATGAGHLWYARHLNDYARAPQPLGAQQFAAFAAPAADAFTTTPAAVPAAATADRDGDAARRPAAVRADKTKIAAATAQPSSLRNSSSTAAPTAKPASTGPIDRPDQTNARQESEAPSKAATSLRKAGAAPVAPAAAPEPQASAARAPAATDDAVIVSRPANPGAALETRALELLARGRSVEAMGLLAQLLQQAPDNAKARATLAALQAEAGRRDLALQTLLAGSTIEPARFAAAAARLQAELGDARAALATLDRVPEAVREAAHDALVGGIAQRAGEHTRAVDAFQRALRTPNAPAVWWAGLAISLESLDRRTPALDAFRRAAADPSLPVAARTYALDRIAALTTPAQAGRAGAVDSAVAAARP
jgi:tetratricopeptide (TPR) repeat protein